MRDSRHGARLSDGQDPASCCQPCQAALRSDNKPEHGRQGSQIESQYAEATGGPTQSACAELDFEVAPNGVTLM
jgi:hypothetical protein